MFKKGDLVEITGSDSGREDIIGLRFVLEESVEVFSIDLWKHVYAWRTPVKDHYARECYLKKVNPDGDELSSESFEEIMKSLKSKKHSDIVTINVTLEKTNVRTK